MTSLTPAQIKQAARVLAEARRGRFAIDTLPPECRPRSVAEGYAIQNALAEELRYDNGGWFCACTNVEVQQKLGLGEPYSARLFKHDIFETPAAFPADHFPSTIVMECEFAFRLGSDLKPRTRPYERNEVIDAVDTLHPSIEIVSGHFTDWLNMGIAHTIADNGTDGALAYGPGVDDWQALDLIQMPVTLDINSKTIRRGRGSNVLGDPLTAMVWLVNAVCQRGHELKSGGLYNTGTATSMQVAQPGDQVIANFEGLGSVEVNLGD